MKLNGTIIFYCNFPVYGIGEVCLVSQRNIHKKFHQSRGKHLIAIFIERLI